MRIAILQPWKSIPFKRWGEVLGWYPDVIRGTVASHLREKGHECEYILVYSLKGKAVEKVLSFLKEKDFDLIFYFPGNRITLGNMSPGFESRLLEEIESTFIFNGVYSFLGDSRVDYNIVLNTIEAIEGFVEYRQEERNIGEVPNLFYKEGKTIRCSGEFRKLGLEDFLPLISKLLGVIRSKEFIVDRFRDTLVVPMVKELKM